MTVFYIALTLLSWASSFVAMRMAIEDFSAGGLVLARCLVSAILMLIVVLPKHGVRGLFRVSLGEWGKLILMALAGALLYNLFLARGQKTLSTFGASVLINTVPIWTAAFAVVLLRESFGWRAWSGVGLGFVGAILVGASAGGLSFEALGVAAVLLAALCQGLYFVLLRSVVSRLGAGRCTALTFLLASLAAILFYPSLVLDLATASEKSILSILYLSLVPGGLGVWSWSRAARHLPASRQASFLYLVPPLTALLG